MSLAIHTTGALTGFTFIQLMDKAITFPATFKLPHFRLRLSAKNIYVNHLIDSLVSLTKTVI